MNTHKRRITSHPSCQTRPVKGTCVSSAFELLRKLLHHNPPSFPCYSNAMRISATQLSQIQHVDCSSSGPSARCGGGVCQKSQPFPENLAFSEGFCQVMFSLALLAEALL